MLSEDDRVALIRRERSGAAPYCPFPGGGIEAGETAGDAAIREAYEELGIQVRLKGLLAVVEFNGDTQHHFNASRATGTFGTGNGGEQAAPATSATGSYTPVWMPPRRDAPSRRPSAGSCRAARRHNLPAAPLTSRETR